MPLLSHITITNCKSIINQDFDLSAFTPLIGYNNAGKSNILFAIKWLLRRSSLGKECFHDPALAVTVEGKVTGIDNNALQMLPANHRAAITPFIQNGVIRIKRMQNIPDESATNIRLYVLDLNPADPTD